MGVRQVWQRRHKLSRKQSTGFLLSSEGAYALVRMLHYNTPGVKGSHPGDSGSRHNEGVVVGLETVDVYGLASSTAQIW